MNALLRYAMLKGTREQFVYALLFTPAMLFFTPLVGMGLVNLLRGRGGFPLSLNPGGLTGAETMGMLTVPSVLLAGIIAGTGAFWVFKSEVAARTIGFFFLARRTGVVALAAALFGAMMGIGSYFIATVVVGILTTALPQDPGLHVTAAVLSSMLTASLGALLVGLSAELNMLIPVYPAGVITGVVLLRGWSWPATLGVLVLTAMLLGVATWLWRRRCGA